MQRSPRKQCTLGSFLQDSTGSFNIGTVIALAAFVMLCYIVVQDKTPTPWVVAPFTIIVVGYFAADTTISRIVARGQTGQPETQILSESTMVDSQSTSITPANGQS